MALLFSPTPFQIASTLIFVCAIIHMFLTPSLYDLSIKLGKKKELFPERWKHYHFLSEIIYLLSEVEVVFGIWLIPLLIVFSLLVGWSEATAYINSRDYTLALYITVVLVVIGSRPIIAFAERILEWVARLGKDSPGAWWWTILTVGPLFGAIIKEPAAMALSAILLGHKFYKYRPSKLFQYATLGLLFANISVGGMLTTFASRALFIVADKWQWDWKYMLVRFGWKALLGILLSNTLYYFIFRKEFARSFPEKLPPIERDEKERHTPFWITFVHIIFLTLVVISSESPALFIGIFILFLGFWRATSFYQSPLHLNSAILIGFFFAALIVHGELQEWWVIPIIQDLSNFGAMIASFVLSAFMDNAIVSYITLDIPQANELKHYLVISGAMSAGALTVVANAPNPIGHSVLRPSFNGKISFLNLFLGAVTPCMIFLAIFWFFR
ncbi:MAG: hypothetical protein S4CHLAM123_11910 [Chlamydiales bacterium]|nr:hypothetical protein [Chlamydiales bacterium]